MGAWERLSEESFWQEFLNYKIEKQHLSEREQEIISRFIGEKKYSYIISEIKKSDYIPPIPKKSEVNKAQTGKKRVVYSFEDDFNIFLKGIAFYLYVYDGEFADNCYAFRRSFGVKDAIRRLKSVKKLEDKWCLKLDIHNYFNSIDVSRLLSELSFIKEQDSELYFFLDKLLTTDKAYILSSSFYGKAAAFNNKSGNKDAESDYVIVNEKRGAMAGIPISPFLANVYLKELDRDFERADVLYFRYSDDILIFADSEDKIREYQKKIYDVIKEYGLLLNPNKVKLCKPKEKWEFLGFCYNKGEIDLSENTIKKMKAKIKRKAHALRRWADKKKASGERTAMAFIKAVNKKLYSRDESREFSWSRWFFPCITTDSGLKTLDDYIQRYIRYCATGRHYKGNYRISYDKLKEWGYRNLVNEYWNGKMKK